ncbi:hypothetical protein F0261_15100 [Alteromonas sp. 07-89-2]|jgi:hypothetical protein|uniref:hypothetical protein n=1 Tax=unclassified Alteromonas TaxID=2614992 RepID=UPI00148BB811|nr:MULTISPECIES: hypothetical protein [unclassified Alteromonas]MCG7636861.1 DUF3344 domain-containing protein [Alteromonas sp. CNT1-28]MCG7813924.1 DUF3344 domain-containing protein [Alteromonas sp. MCA-1]NOH59363.1 hypothetical protein [Alteromonas sp. 07-89-2]
MKNIKTFSLLLFIFGSLQTHASVITSAGTFFDTDIAYAGVGGLRGNGSGDITLSGTSGSIEQAYLYWHGPTNSSDPSFNASALFNGTSIVGTNIGFSDDNFWGQDNSQAYRADVTNIITGDGIYSLSGLSPNNSNGASLVVYYDDGDDSNNTDVVTFEGNDANFDNIYDPLGWDTSLSGINYNSGSARLLLGVSDGQSFADGLFSINGSVVNVDFDGLSVPATAGSSVTNGALWDLFEFDVTSYLTVGLNSLNISYSGGSDALSAIHYQVILPAGAAPDQPGDVVAVSAPSISAYFILVLAGLIFCTRCNQLS